MRTRKNAVLTGGEAGFTLVEVLVGSFLLAIVLTSAFGSYFIGLKVVDESRQEVRASQIIQSEMEAMRTMNWNDLGMLATKETITPQGEFVDQYAMEFEVYREIESLNGIQKRVTVLVSWVNSNNQVTYRRFTTVFTKNGLNDYYYREA